MLLLPTLASNNTLARKQFEITDTVSLFAIFGPVGFLTFYLFSFAERLRKEVPRTTNFRLSPPAMPVRPSLT